MPRDFRGGGRRDFNKRPEMMNPNQPQKKGFRAFADRDNERKIAEEAVAPAKITPEQPATNEAVKTSPIPGK
jgi:hypothetical protein